MLNKIRQAIEEKNLKITNVIRNIRVSKSYFYDVMNGNSIPSLVVARKIAHELKVPLNELFPEQKFDSY
ncbi:helix-turn-helix transcriptional regulator [Clostridium sp. JS66]|uniref:helix-turn-helix transcriptional regulator n=1 Tax=Clostridium sp. JS66 TaxID=3064705 RepID=UPI00298E49A5|nr:helix-turn-helix transcriptional regulator [Clostridium sp. JS66]WPC40636.1 helix-turn-helix transcriptional regulator [Clostridium sp. JS66]